MKRRRQEHQLNYRRLKDEPNTNKPVFRASTDLIYENQDYGCQEYLKSEWVTRS